MVTNSKAHTVLCFGDSNTWGRSPDGSKRYSVNERWPGVLQDLLGDGYNVIEEGLPSRTTNVDYKKIEGKNGLTYLRPCIESHIPLDTIVVMLGTNDLKTEFGRSAEDITSGLEQIILLIKELARNSINEPSSIVIVSPASVNWELRVKLQLESDSFDQNSEQTSKDLAVSYQYIADRYACEYVDSNLVAVVGEDGLHLTQQSHVALARTLISKVR